MNPEGKTGATDAGCDGKSWQDRYRHALALDTSFNAGWKITEPDEPDEGYANDITLLYLKQIENIPRLTFEQEVEFAQRMERGKVADKRLQELEETSYYMIGWSLIDIPSFKQAVADGSQAREELITSYLPLVWIIAQQYTQQGVPPEDLIQEGNLGLMRAVDKFDYRKGNLRNYAPWWIREACKQAVKGEADYPEGPVQDPTLLIEKTVEDPDVPNPERETIRSSLRETIEDALQKSPFPPKEAVVLQSIFGLIDEQARTLEEVGNILGLSRERVRQLEIKGLIRLRHPSKEILNYYY